MNWKKLGKALIFPPIPLMIPLIPLSVAFLACAVVLTGSESVPAIISYVLSAYTLTVWCFRIPRIIRFIKTAKEKNPLVVRLLNDAGLRVSISLYGSLFWNAAYAAVHVWLGYTQNSYWFYSLACYYVMLAVMRFFLLNHTRRFKPGEKMRYELKKYRACGWIMLAMNLTLFLMVFFMIYWNRTFYYHEIITIALAAYTFTAFTVGIINIKVYRRYQSPVYSAAKAISFASACVSMLTLETAMLTTFGQETMDLANRRLILALTGAAISIVIIVMSVYMILQSTKKLKNISQN